ncbi:MAG: MBL fold metallo-hydrolase [Oligoflexia bacterium]|nr:MBL fold metallo-hydrolase [Oligoflexia bacterium]
MLKFQAFVVNHFFENTYLVYDESSKEALIIDPGLPEKKLDQFIQTHDLKVMGLVCTHCHPDHIAGVNYYKSRLKAPFWIHRGETQILDAYEQWAPALGFEPVAPVPTDYYRGGDEFYLGDSKLKIIETPGHSPGGVCFHCAAQKILFSGDSLFQRSIGRTDFPGGNHDQLLQSIRSQLFTLEGTTQVFPGHGEATSIKEEIEENPFL